MGLALINELRWYPREPTAPDYGIDLYVECADDGVPNGRMLGLQVKGGSSFFTERSDEGVVFRGQQRHLDYWLGHSLPVLVVLYHPDEQAAWWQAVTPENVELTGTGWKLLVPSGQRLDARAAPLLTRLAEADEYTLRLNALRADRSWMTLLQEGGAVWLDVEEWVNKTSGRGAISLLSEPARDGGRLERSRDVYLGLLGYEQALPLLFPWAHLAVDEDLYTEHEEQLWELEEGHYDSEEGRTVMLGSPFEEWRELRGLNGIRAYQIEADELARWHLTLSLNELGRSFLALDEHLGRTG